MKLKIFKVLNKSIVLLVVFFYIVFLNIFEVFAEDLGVVVEQEARLIKKNPSIVINIVEGFFLLWLIVLFINQRKLKNRLLLEQKRLEGFLYGTNVGTWEWNVQTGETIFNERWAEIVGYTLKELLPVSIKTWEKLCHPDDMKVSEELLEKHFRKELDYYECEIRMKHKNGEWVWVLDRGRVISWTEDGKPLMMMGTHQDISERKKIDMELATWKKRYDLIGAASGQVAYEYNVDTKGIVWGKSMEEVLGYKADEINGGIPQWIEWLHPDDREKTLAYLDKTEKECGFWDAEYRLRHKNGEYVWIRDRGFFVADALGQPQRQLGVVENITVRKLVEEMLRLTQFSVDNASDSIFWITEDARFHFVNDAACRRLGYSKEELLSMHVYDIDFRFTLQRWQTYWKEILSQHHAVFESKHRAKDGRIIPVEVSTTYVKYGGKEYNFAFVRDISERKHAEALLKESEERFRSTFEQMAVGIAHVSLDGKFLRMNKKFCDIVGYTEQEIITKTFQDITHPDDLSRDLEQVNRILANEIKTYSIEKRYLRKDSSIVWVNLTVSLVQENNVNSKYFISVVEDISARKHIEENLHIAQFAMERASYSILLVDEVGKIFYANDRACSSMGYTREELIKKKVFDIDPDFKPEIWDDHKAKLRVQGSLTFESRHQRKDGSIYPVEVCGNYIEYEGRFFSVAYDHDISERKRAEEELRTMAERFRLANKATNDVIWDWDVIKDTQQWNEAGINVFGWTEIVEHPVDAYWWVERVHPDDRDRIHNSFFAVVNNPQLFSWQDEYRFKKADGTYVDVLDRGFVLRDDQGKAIRMIGAMQNITDRKQAEEENRKLAAVIKHSNELVNLANSEGQMIYLNEAGKRILGIAENEVSEKYIMDIIPDHLKEKVVNEVIPAMKTGVWEGELEYKNLKTGELTIVHAATFPICDSKTGMPLYYANVSLDITARKHAEELLKESERKLADTIQFLPDATFVIDRNKRVVVWNKAIEEMTGILATEMIGQGDYAYTVPFYGVRRPQLMDLVFEDSAEVLAKYPKIIRQGDALVAEVFCPALYSGNGAWVFAKACPLYDASGQRIGAIEIIRDITERKNSEKALKESEDRLRTLINAMPDIVCFKDGQGRWLVANDFDIKLFQLEGVDYRDKKDSELAAYSPFYKDAFLACEETDEKAWLAGTVSRCDEIIPRPDGSFMVFDIIKVPMFYPDGKRKGLIVVGRDITTRKAIEEKLRKSEERFKAIFDTSFQFVGLMTCEGILIETNISAVEFAGVSIEEVINIPFWETPWWKGNDERVRKLQESILLAASGEFVRYEVELQGKQGSAFFDFSIKPIFDSDGKVVLLVPEGRNINERKQFEEELRNERDFSKTLVDTSPIFFVAISKEGKLVMANNAFYDTLGYTHDDLVGCDYVDKLILPAEREFMLKLFNDIVSKREKTVSENHVIAKDGHVILVEWHGVPIFRKERFDFFFGVGVDITQRKESDIDKERLFNELQMINKEMETIIYATSHDLRSPLINLLGFSQHLNKSCQDLYQSVEKSNLPEEIKTEIVPIVSEKIPKFLNFIQASGNKMDMLISGLLRLSRMGRIELHWESLNMKKIFENILTAMAFQIQSMNIVVNIGILSSCWADELLINQVFSNLIDNAIKYRNPEHPLEITITSTVNPNSVLYVVRDTGKGIPSDYQSKIWDLFSRLDPNGPVPGEGLGLTIARRIIERHHGKIWVESEEGKGSAFFVELPAKNLC